MNITYNEFEKAIQRLDLVVYWDKAAGELDLIGDGRIAYISTEKENVLEISKNILKQFTPSEATTIRTLCLGLAGTPLEKREL